MILIMDEKRLFLIKQNGFLDHNIMHFVTQAAAMFCSTYIAMFLKKKSQQNVLFCLDYFFESTNTSCTNLVKKECGK